jgi:hypothetical protein
MSMTFITVLLLSASSICIGASFQSVQPIYADGLDFKRIKNLSNNDVNSLSPRIAVSGNNVYVVWYEIGVAGNLDIFFKRSTDGGKTFDRTKNLSNNPAASLDPQIAASGNNVYVAWDDGITVERTNSDVSFKRSTDRGDHFDRTKNLSNNPAETSASQPRIAASGNNVYVVWSDNTLGEAEVSFKRSTDRGDDFDRTKNLSNNAGFSFDPQIAAAGNSVYVAWADTTPGNSDVFFKRSTDRGDDFDRTKNLSNNDGSSTDPSIAASENNVYVVWNDLTPGNLDIFFKRSTDRGHDFVRTKNLSNNDRFSMEPRIATSGNNVYVVWNDLTPGNLEILFKRSTDRGHDFDRTKNLSNNAAFSELSQIAASGNNVYVAWADTTPGRTDVFFKRSTDRGDDFDRTKNLSDNDGSALNPQIAVSGNNVYVVWFDNTPSNFDVFFRRGTQ